MVGDRREVLDQNPSRSLQGRRRQSAIQGQVRNEPRAPSSGARNGSKDIAVNDTDGGVDPRVRPQARVKKHEVF